MRKWRAKRVLEDPRGLLESGFDIAVLPHHVRLKIVAGYSFRQLGRVLILVSIFVNQRRGRLQCFDRIVDEGQFLIFDIDQADRLVGNRFVIRRDSRDRIAARAHFVIGQHRLVFHACTNENILNVGTGEHGMNTRQCFSFRCVDVDNARVRHRSAQHLSPQ